MNDRFGASRLPPSGRHRVAAGYNRVTACEEKVEATSGLHRYTPAGLSVCYPECSVIEKGEPGGPPSKQMVIIRHCFLPPCWQMTQLGIYCFLAASTLASAALLFAS